MEVALLGKLLGRDQQWRGACTLIVDAEASVQTIGADSIVQAGAKVYAPRLISGRIMADNVLLLADNSAVLVLQQQRIRQATGEEVTKQTLTVLDPRSIVGIEFMDTAPLAALGILPPAPKAGGSHSGVHQRPKIS